jgi:hypothetical protein
MSSAKLSKAKNRWDGVIADARKRIQKLQTVISVCEENKKKGEPWPGSQQSATHN